jgi:hypothetical protein
MEHPLINNIDSLSVEELQTRINDLTKKLNWASRSGNAQLRSQIQMALETFKTKYYEKQQAIYDAARKNDPDFSDKIDIS